MVKITIENLGQKTIIEQGRQVPALRVIHENGIDWMHDCGGKGRCTTCKMIVVKGLENLSSVTPAELKYRQEGALKSNERLACQTRILGEIHIRVAEQYKLPHVKYSE
jgi:ferredoxin, 2Fe-2S